MKKTPVGESITRPSKHTNPIKKTLCLLLSLVMLLSITAGLDLSAYAYDGDSLTSGDFKYVVRDNNSVQIVRYIGKNSTVTFPSQINGYIVTEIGDGENVIKERAVVKKVLIPNTVKSIGDVAFSYCENLTECNIPDSVINIGSEVFSNTGLYYDSSNWVNDCAFYLDNCLLYIESWAYGTFTVKNGTRLIADINLDYMFSDKKGITEFIIPDSVVHISDGALSSDGLEKVIIGSSAIINEGCLPDDLKCKIEVSSENNYCKVLDDALYTKDGKTLIRYFGDNETFTIPDGVTILNNASFGAKYGWGGNVKKIYIPASVKNIDEALKSDSIENITVDENNPYFSSENGVLFNKNKTELLTYPAAKKIEEYVVPNTVTSIRDYAFWGDPDIKYLYIPNSVTDIGEYWLGTSITDIIAVCDADSYAYDFVQNSDRTELKITPCKNHNFIKGICTICNDIDKQYSFQKIKCDEKVSIDNNNYDDYYNKAFVYEFYPSVTGEYYVNIDGNISSSQYDCCMTDENGSLIVNGYYNSEQVLSADSKYYLTIILRDTGNLELSVELDHRVCDNWGYSLSNGKAVIDCLYYGNEETKELPLTVDGYTVSKLDVENYSRFGTVKELIIPDAVTYPIQLNAFEGLKRIYIGEGFNDKASISGLSPDIEEINVSQNNPYFSSSDGVLFNKEKTELIRYPQLKDREEYTIPESVKIIGDFAFNKCEELKNIKFSRNIKKIGKAAFQKTNLTENLVIPNGVTSIGEWAFAASDTLKKVSIPATVTTIGENAFIHNRELEEVNVNKNNKNYSSSDGVLFNKSKTILFLYPCANKRTSYKIPNGVKEIGIKNSEYIYWMSGRTRAFFDCKYLKNVVYPITLKEILQDEIMYNAFRSKSIVMTFLNPTLAFSEDQGAFVSINEFATIKGYKNSTAHKYAKDENLKFEALKCTHTYKKYVTKTTTKKNGVVVTRCSVCQAVKSKSTIYYPEKIKLSSTSYTYNGKVRKPSVTVINSKGNKISSKYYTVTYAKGRKNVGKYTVTIKFKGNYSGTVKKTFTIKPKTTSISSLTAKSKGFTVKWKKQATQTTGYQIQYATNSKFTKNKKTVTVSKNKTTSKKISNLKAKKKYYVRVRTYKTVNGKKIYSSWSKYKSVTTKK